MVKLREKRGFSQMQLANQAGVPRTTISNMESGYGNPTLSNVLKVSKALQISLEELISRPTDEIHHLQASEIKLKKKLKGVEVFNLLPHPLENMELERLELDSYAYMGGTPHLKNTKEYFICLKGQILITVEGESFKLKKGGVLIFPGDCRHSYRNENKENCLGISVLVRPF